MTFYDRVESFAMASDAAADFDGLVKVAEDSGVTVNDLIVHHNLTQGNLFTGENLIKIAEEIEPSALLGAVNVFEKMASDNYSDEDAMAELASYGLEVEDYEKVAEALNGQMEEIALDRDLDKVAEAHAFLEENGIDPVSAITLITDLNNIGSPEEGEKIASEYSDLDADMEDKLAQVQDFLMDLEVVHPEDAMIAYDKEAGVLNDMSNTEARIAANRELYKNTEYSVPGKKKPVTPRVQKARKLNGETNFQRRMTPEQREAYKLQQKAAKRAKTSPAAAARKDTIKHWRSIGNTEGLSKGKTEAAKELGGSLRGSLRNLSKKNKYLAAAGLAGTALAGAGAGAAYGYNRARN